MVKKVMDNIIANDTVTVTASAIEYPTQIIFRNFRYNFSLIQLVQGLFR